nr:ATP-binding protein [Psychrobacter frigidicola]
MNDLPFRQTGMGTENCHPRFVACLLRLGDLFDIDDNRFCPIMARQVSNMPSFSETHKHKHQAIREFQLDNETVSVTAICSTEMAYIECRNWFDWIKEEIQNQMSQWKNIVPHRDFGLLPTINKLDVEMDDSKILLDGKPMKFSLDERSAIELLQGNNLYKDDMSIYRELIQNAIDATMIRVWLEHGQNHSSRKLPKNGNPYDKDTQSLFADYPITLDCKKVADDEDSTLWEFSIEDNGVGISRTDLEYMQKIAGSKNNKEKQKIVHQMPEWMRPSGEFGIGLHSAFLLMKDLPAKQQKITIFTKSRLTHESLKIELSSPLSGRNGYCFIKKISDLGNYGTNIIVLEKITKIKSIQKNITDNHSYVILENLARFNGIKIQDLNHLIRLMKVKYIVENPLVNIMNSEKLEILNTCTTKNENNKPIYYWDRKNNSAMSIRFDEDITLCSTSRKDSRIKFRGQYIEPFSYRIGSSLLPTIFSMNNISVTFDIYNINASKAVSLNREKIKDRRYIYQTISKVYKNFMENSKNGDTDLIDEMFNNNEIHTSFLLSFGEIDSSLDLTLLQDKADEWKEIKIQTNKKLKDVLKSNAFINTDFDDLDLDSLIAKTKIDDILTINSSMVSYLLKNKYFQEILIKEGFSRYYISDENISKSSDFFLYSKPTIESLNIKKIDLNDSPFIVNSLKSFYNIYRHDGLENIAFERISSLKEFRSQYSFLPKTIIENIIRLSLKEGVEPFIVLPFSKINDIIIEIANEKIIQCLELVNSDRDLDLIYTEMKSYLIDNSKLVNPGWYEAYE